MLPSFGWRMSFVLLGLAGIGWAVVWLFWFRDHPPEPVIQAQTDTSQEVTFGQIFRSRGMFLAMTQYFAGNFTFFICLSWMHPYLKSHYKLTDAEAAAYSMVPLLVGATAQWLTGFLVDRLYRSEHREWSRRLPAMVGFSLAAAGVLAVAQMTTAAAAVACFTVATFGAEMTISPSWAYCVDIAGKNSGTVTASMNMLGNLGSFASANAFPWLYGMTGSAAAYFRLAAVLNVAAILCWIGMRSLRRRLGSLPA
jgi:ACS family glucarate transporter-like MFS transporter